MRRLAFSTWARVMIAAAKIDSRVYRNHIRPQSDLVREGSEVFKLENGFVDMVAWLNEITNSTALDITVDHLLKRPSEPIDLAREDAEEIANFYACDYARFGYPLPDFKSLPSRRFPMWKRPFVAAMARALVIKQRRLWVQ